ncbi:MAG: acyl-CoA thioesterase [Hyphomonadaceae bacterium]
MTLIFRLIILYIRTAFSKHKMDIHTLHTMKFRVWITDHDMFQHMNNSRYFSITDIALMNWMIETGLWRGLRKQDWTPMVVFKDASYLSSLRFPEAYRVETQLIGWSGSYIIWRHEYRNRKNQLAAVVNTVGRVVAADSQHPSADDVIVRLGMDVAPSPDIPPIYRARLNQLEVERGKRSDELAHAPPNGESNT